MRLPWCGIHAGDSVVSAPRVTTDLESIARTVLGVKPAKPPLDVCKCRDCGAHCEPGCYVNEYGRLCDECSGRAQDERNAEIARSLREPC
jgi:hypothetical protein